MIQNPEKRKAILREFETVQFTMTVRDVGPHRGTLSNPQFTGPIHFDVASLRVPPNPGDEVVGTVDVVRLVPGSTWEFKLKSGNLTSLGRAWIQLLEDLITVRIRPSSRRRLQKTLEHLSGLGFQVNDLEAWTPDVENVEDLRRLYDLSVNLERASQSHERIESQIKQHMMGVLPGNVLNAIVEKHIGQIAPVRQDITPRAPSMAPRRPVIDFNKLKENETARNARLKLSLLPDGEGMVSAADFAKKSDHFLIFIDENWPDSHPESKKKTQTGTIAGIVWRGAEIDFEILPELMTHAKASPAGLKGLKDLMQCKRCYPFVMPIKIPRFGSVASIHYDILLEQALVVLLGWVMPATAGQAKVSIFLEKIGETHEIGEDRTQYFSGLFQGLAWLNPKRFARWIINEVKWWDKEDGYIPYADLLGYVSDENVPIARELAKQVNLEKWPGFIRLSPEIFDLLGRLEMLERSGNVGDVLDFSRLAHGTQLYGIVINELAARLQHHRDLQHSMIAELEQRYESKDRDLVSLKKCFEAVCTLVPELPPDAKIRSRLLWTALRFQNANHDGDPARIEKEVRAYEALRPLAMQHDRELAAFTELLLGVHFADRFEFIEAYQTILSLTDDPYFDALTPLNQARAWSSLGQYSAMKGYGSFADICFKTALDLLEATDLTTRQKNAEINQTSIYRAINSLDNPTPETMKHVIEALGPIEKAVELLAGSEEPGEVYKHHLLLRMFNQTTEFEAQRKNYLGRIRKWKSGTEHPWPLINMYRGMFLSEAGKSAEADYWLNCALRSAVESGHGATLIFVAGVIAAVAFCCLKLDKYKRTSRNAIKRVAPMLPAVAYRCARVEEALNQAGPECVPGLLALLPFNYH